MMEEKEAKLDDTSGFKEFKHYVEWVLHQEAPDVISVFPPKSRKWPWLNQLLDWRSWPRGLVVCTVIVALFLASVGFMADIKSTTGGAQPQPPAAGISWVNQIAVPQAQTSFYTETPDETIAAVNRLYGAHAPLQFGPHGETHGAPDEIISVTKNQTVIIVAHHLPVGNPPYAFANKPGQPFAEACLVQPGAMLDVIGKDGNRKLVRYQESLPSTPSTDAVCHEGDLFFERIA